PFAAIECPHFEDLPVQRAFYGFGGFFYVLKGHISAAESPPKGLGFRLIDDTVARRGRCLRLAGEDDRDGEDGGKHDDADDAQDDYEFFLFAVHNFLLKVCPYLVLVKTCSPAPTVVCSPQGRVTSAVQPAGTVRVNLIPSSVFSQPPETVPYTLL